MSDRRGFFASLKSLALGEGSSEPSFSPLLPGFISGHSAKCSECAVPGCQTLCPEGIVFRNEKKAPSLDFSKRGCTFCGECAAACEHNLFVAEPVNRIDAEIRIGILDCLAWNKTICRSCADVCNDKAIEFTGLFNPEINAELCTACGFCIGVCPAYTIEIHPGRKA